MTTRNVDHRGIVGTISAPPISQKFALAEPMPPQWIEAIEGTVWLAEHDAAIRKALRHG